MPQMGAGEDGSCLGPRGHCDRHQNVIWTRKKKNTSMKQIVECRRQKNKKCFLFLISHAILLSLIIHMQPLFHTELNAFKTCKILTILDTTMKNLDDDMPMHTHRRHHRQRSVSQPRPCLQVEAILVCVTPSAFVFFGFCNKHFFAEQGR
jgi:hypothetical protein